MADNTSLRSNSLPQVSNGLGSIQKVLALPASGIANADTVAVFALPVDAKWRILNVIVRTSATLGASATVQARINRAGTRTVASAATTAGGASKVDSAAQAGMPFEALGGDVVELLVGGAGITAAANATVDIIYAHRS